MLRFKPAFYSPIAQRMKSRLFSRSQTVIIHDLISDILPNYSLHSLATTIYNSWNTPCYLTSVSPLFPLASLSEIPSFIHLKILELSSSLSSRITFFMEVFVTPSRCYISCQIQWTHFSSIHLTLCRIWQWVSSLLMLQLSRCQFSSTFNSDHFFFLGCSFSIYP